VQTGLLTVDKYLKLPDPKEGHHELHHGEVVVMPRRPKYEVWQAGVGYISLELDEATGDDEYLMGAPEVLAGSSVAQ